MQWQPNFASLFRWQERWAPRSLWGQIRVNVDRGVIQGVGGMDTCYLKGGKVIINWCFSKSKKDELPVLLCWDVFDFQAYRLSGRGGRGVNDHC